MLYHFNFNCLLATSRTVSNCRIATSGTSAGRPLLPGKETNWVGDISLA